MAEGARIVYLIEPMTQADVEEVSRLERRCFTNPWPVSAYRRELRAPQQNYYSVLRDWPDDAVGVARMGSNGPSPDDRYGGLRQRLATLAGSRLHGQQARAKPPIIGFAGMWVLYEEAHITTIAVEPSFRGNGLGELLLMDLFDEAQRRNGTWVTLEVRVTNAPAQNLYRKYGFTIEGRRPRYYSDNNEDAFIMWSGSLKDYAYIEQLAKLKRGIERRLRFADEASPSR
jgi:ribosomal-protein-alanine N-acetyltransferase